MLNSYFRAGTGAVCIETREENRLLMELRLEFPDAELAIMNAPQGDIVAVMYDERAGRIVRKKEPLAKQASLKDGYAWLAKSPKRILIVLDWHMLTNAPGHWRMLIEALPAIRCPEGEGASSMVVFVAPSFDFSVQNPLRGQVPIIQYDTPNRASLRATLEAVSPLPAGDAGEKILDAVCGLSADTAEQVAAENLIAHGGTYNAPALNDARRKELKSAGLEIWTPVYELGGLGGLKDHIENEVLPFIRDDTLAIRRLLMAGVPGVGKSFVARWLAGKLGCECARLSIPAMKAGLVGASEANLRRAFRTLDTMAKESPLVVVLDEIDTIARDGADGGTSSAMFGETLQWLQESKSLCVVVATLNRLDNLDSAMESRFSSRLFFDLPSVSERRDVAGIHYRRVGMESEDTVNLLADLTDGYSNRELAETLVPSIARMSRRNPTPAVVNTVVAAATPVSVTQKDQLEKMRNAASTLLKANDSDDRPVGGRRVSI